MLTQMNFLETLDSSKKSQRKGALFTFQQISGLIKKNWSLIFASALIILLSVLVIVQLE